MGTVSSSPAWDPGLLGRPVVLLQAPTGSQPREVSAVHLLLWPWYPKVCQRLGGWSRPPASCRQASCCSLLGGGPMCAPLLAARCARVLHSGPPPAVTAVSAGRGPVARVLCVSRACPICVPPGTLGPECVWAKQGGLSQGLPQAQGRPAEGARSAPVSSPGVSAARGISTRTAQASCLVLTSDLRAQGSVLRWGEGGRRHAWSGGAEGAVTGRPRRARGVAGLQRQGPGVGGALQAAVRTSWRRGWGHCAIDREDDGGGLWPGLECRERGHRMGGGRGRPGRGRAPAV